MKATLTGALCGAQGQEGVELDRVSTRSHIPSDCFMAVSVLFYFYAVP